MGSTCAAYSADQHDQFVATARYWTENYATEKAKDEKLQKLKEMGFEAGRCTLSPPDPQLKGAWYPGGFQPLRLSREKPV
jgi:hypothetical protein